MSFIEGISLKMSDNLGNRLDKTEEEKAILNYGIFVIIHTSLAIISTLLVGILTGTALEIITISLVSALLKRCSGGVHANTPTRCLVIGVLITFILSVSQIYLIEGFENNILAIILLTGIIFSYYILYKKCPVGSKNKPLQRESTRKKLRKKAFQLTHIYCIIIIAGYTNYIIYGNDIIKKISISIFLGLLLQIFSLLKVGEKSILLLDSILDKFKIFR